ncbi:MAG: Crp/Fnr family transcriptional regulator [Bacteroidota bacterium]
MSTITLKKGEILQRPGELNSKIYRVNSGLLRSYSLDKKGKEHIFLFAPEGTIMVDHIPPNVPADLFIDALEDSVVSVLDKNFFNSHQNMPEMIHRIDGLQKRVIMLMGGSILDRYQHFVATYPQIVSRIPQRMIASYLGVTPEALSKAKRKK